MRCVAHGSSAPHAAGPNRIDLIVACMPRKELIAEAACRLDGVARVAQHVAAGITVTVHDPDEGGARVAGEFLDLADHRAGNHREGLLRAQHEPDALTLHAAD